MISKGSIFLIKRKHRYMLVTYVAESLCGLKKGLNLYSRENQCSFPAYTRIGLNEASCPLSLLPRLLYTKFTVLYKD